MRRLTAHARRHAARLTLTRLTGLTGVTDCGLTCAHAPPTTPTAPELREAIDRTGYYPEVVADGVEAAVAGEQVVSFYVHHEPTFERDEVRRHMTVVVLTPTRLILAPHRRARRRRPAARALHLDLDRGDQR